MKTVEEMIASYSDRDEWWIAPTSPHHQTPREWRQSEEEAFEEAQKFAIKYGCTYEVYKRVGTINPKD